MYFANADELPERTRGENRDLFHDSEMARTPVSSGARRFSEGTYLIRELSKSSGSPIDFAIMRARACENKR